MASYSPIDETERKKINLMSIVESLHPESFFEHLPRSSNIALSSNLSSYDSPKPAASASNSGLETTATIEDEDLDSREIVGGEDDIMENLFHVINGLSSGGRFQNIPKDSPVSPPENDETLLEMQHPPEGKKAGMQALIQSYANGTSDVKSIMNNDINFIYECKRCRGIFRSLPNLIRHKNQYCKNTGLLSSFMNRPTNSTQDEDQSFRQFLDTLYPPDPPLYSVPPPAESRNAGLKPAVAVGNLKPVRVNLVQMKSSAINTSCSQTITDSKPGQVVPLPISSPLTMSPDSGKSLRLLVSSPANPTHPATNLTKSQLLSALLPSSNLQPEKKHICPICDKSFAGRKNVRRHLINVHRVSQMEAVKLINSLNLTKNRSGRKTGVELKDLCVESIKLTPNQIIQVLPENVEISSSDCPVCGRQLCRKSNVRRHLMETHKMVVKNDKKYWKLRQIASNSMSNSPSSKTLRFLITSDTSSPSPTRNSTSSLGNSLQRMTPINISQPLSILPRVAASSEAKKADLLAINKVTFVESNPVRSSSMKILQALPSSAMPSAKANVQGKNSPIEDKQGKAQMLLSNGPAQSKGRFSESSQLKDNVIKSSPNSTKENDGNDVDPSYKCLPCNKAFSRRQTYQNHMCTFHKSTGEELEKKSNTPKTVTNSIQRKRLVHDANEDCNSDNEPLQRLRKRRNTESNKSLIPLCNEDSDPDSMPLQKLRKLSAAVPVREANHGGSNSRIRSLSHDRTSTVISNINSEFSRNPDTVPLATTTTILSSSIVKSNDSSAPQKEKVTALTQNFVLRRLSLDNPRSSAVTMLRPIIKVQLKNSAVAAKATGTNQTKKITSPQSKSQFNAPKVQFDFAKLVCHTCLKTFQSTPDLKSHLLSLHSFSEEEARSSCYDLTLVDKEAQEDGLEYGFDINQAKCLLCSRHYFSREILHKHLSRFHHLEDELLVGLKASFTPVVRKTTTAMRNGDSRPNKNQQKNPAKQASSLLQNLAVSSTSQRPIKGASTASRANSARSPPSVPRSPELVPFFFSKARVMEALKTFPKEYVNTTAMRCTKCKHRYHKTWDLKMHLLRHLKIGLFACRYCEGEEDSKPHIARSGDLIKHLALEHNIRVTGKNREKYFNECRMNLTNLWEAYGLPLGKVSK